MKTTLLLVVILLSSLQSFSQDPNIVGTWYLRAFLFDLGPDQLISHNNAPQNPTFAIDDNFHFSGLGACNTFIGDFTYDPVTEEYTHENFESTLIDCGQESYNTFEDFYFSHFDGSLSQTLYIYDEGSQLRLEVFPGFGLLFQNTPFLGVKENKLSDFKIYPNPTSNELFIVSENLQINEISIYSISGQVIFNN